MSEISTQHLPPSQTKGISAGRMSQLSQNGHREPELLPAPDPLMPVWEELRANPTLGTIAQIMRGVTCLPISVEEEELLFRTEPEEGFVKGIWQPNEGYEPYLIRAPRSLKSDHIQMPADRKLWEMPKVIAHVSGSASSRWPLVAVVDPEGLLCSQDFYAIWPRGDFPIEVLAAILNSPIANAFLSQKRHSLTQMNLETVIAQIPIPTFEPWTRDEMALWVQKAIAHRQEWLNQPAQTREPWTGYGPFGLLEEEIMSAYHLSFTTERTLINSFSGYERPGPFHPMKVRPSGENKLYKSPLTVERVRNEGGEQIVYVEIFGWDVPPGQLAHFPLSLVSPDLRPKIVEGASLEARVNIGTKDPNGLIFEEITVRPPVSEEFLARLTAKYHQFIESLQAA